MKHATCLGLALLMVAALISAALAPQPPLLVDTLIIETIGDPMYVDPAAAYDSVGGDLIRQVYDSLVQCKRESVAEFEPMLAESWAVRPDGKVWTFKIRSGVKFHNGAILTSEDIEYTFERAMVMDFVGGPTWMFYDVLLGMFTSREYNLTEEAQAEELGRKLDAAIESTVDSVVFTFKEPVAATPWLQILANFWSSILNKAWCVEHGSWPGEWGDYKSWAAYNNPEVPPLDDPEPVLMGTGAYKYDYWQKTVEYSLVKFDDYWQGWPAPSARCYLDRVTLRMETEWFTRKQDFIHGNADIITVPEANLYELNDTAGVLLPGVNCFRGLPTGVCYAVFFTQNINPSSAYIGSGKLDGEGIPPDFFNDVHVRRAFAYCFDFASYIIDPYGGEAIQPRTCMPEEPGHTEWIKPDLPTYSLNLSKAEEEFKLAFDGQLWEKGFKCISIWTSGANHRRTVSDVLAPVICSLNPKFKFEGVGVDWPTFLYARMARSIIIDVLGWHRDFADPHNWFMPFMHSEGDFSFFTRYSNPHADELIERGIRTIDLAARLAIYHELEQIYFDEVPGFFIVNYFGRRYERTWVCGWYSNGLVECRHYCLWKQIVPPDRGYPFEDVNQDGKINMLDISLQAKGFGAYPGQPRWTIALRADVDRNAVVTIVDIAKVAKKFGTTIPQPESH